MNQALEGHSGAVVVIAWNENFRKLTTSDQYGLVTVWSLCKGAWYEDMINNRKKSVVRDIRWDGEGQHVCIVYEDGAVIVGGVDGNRLWGKELPGLRLAKTCWSPDSRRLLFGTLTGEVFVYDSNGEFCFKMPPYCLQDGAAGAVAKSPAASGGRRLARGKADSSAGISARLAAIEWYNGAEGFVEQDCPCLAVCYDNGHMQLMRGEDDDMPVLVNTMMTSVTVAEWSHGGQFLAIGGSQVAADRGDQELSCVQFYSPHGDHLRTLKVGVRQLGARTNLPLRRAHTGAT